MPSTVTTIITTLGEALVEVLEQAVAGELAVHQYAIASFAREARTRSGFRLLRCGREPGHEGACSIGMVAEGYPECERQEPSDGERALLEYAGELHEVVLN